MIFFYWFPSFDPRFHLLIFEFETDHLICPAKWVHSLRTTLNSSLNKDYQYYYFTMLSFSLSTIFIPGLSFDPNRLPAARSLINSVLDSSSRWDKSHTHFQYECNFQLSHHHACSEIWITQMCAVAVHNLLEFKWMNIKRKRDCIKRITFTLH